MSLGNSKNEIYSENSKRAENEKYGSGTYKMVFFGEPKVEFTNFVPETKDGSPRIKSDNIELR